MARIYAFLQARSDSSRLPGKVLKKILGREMILHQLHRLRGSERVDGLILLTSDEESDDFLASVVQRAGYSLFRGKKSDVLARFFDCAGAFGLQSEDIVLRLTGDCPLHHASIVDELIDAFLQSGADYMANCVDPVVYPDGLDAEIFRFRTLEEAHKGAKRPSEREHVTPYIRDCGSFVCSALYKEPIHPEWRLTVDEAEDFELVKRVYEHFGHSDFSIGELFEYLEENPHLTRINSHIGRNEGYLKSLEEES